MRSPRTLSLANAKTKRRTGNRSFFETSGITRLSRVSSLLDAHRTVSKGEPDRAIASEKECNDEESAHGPGGRWFPGRLRRRHGRHQGDDEDDDKHDHPGWRHHQDGNQEGRFDQDHDGRPEEAVTSRLIHPEAGPARLLAFLEGENPPAACHFPWNSLK